uniref:Photosystem I reaction center subunit PsaK n=1 Tax=Storeatula sp. CCMP1868 TaxID=195070 RepID=A0A222AHN2_9CRYP|nr:photosystem I subunit X [Storeatula sp. CCMP1868]
MNADLLIALVPQTVAWSAKTCAVMVLSNVLCIVAGRYVIQVKGTGPSLPISGSFSGFGLPELIASTSLGHIVGSGAILGLSYIGVLS